MLPHIPSTPPPWEQNGVSHSNGKNVSGFHPHLFRRLKLEAFPLVHGIRKLAERISHLSTLHENFETLRVAGFRSVRLRQRTDLFKPNRRRQTRIEKTISVSLHNPTYGNQCCGLWRTKF